MPGSSACAPPAFLGPASNEILLSVGGVPGWGGQIECRIAITGPSGYRHDETQTWFVGPTRAGDQQRSHRLPRSCGRAQGSGGGVASSWTIGSTATTNLSVTRVASTGIPIFDRTTTPILIRQGIVGSPASFDLHESIFRPSSRLLPCHVGDRHVEPRDRRRRFAAATGRFGWHPVLHVVTQVPVTTE